MQWEDIMRIDISVNRILIVSALFVTKNFDEFSTSFDEFQRTPDEIWRILDKFFRTHFYKLLHPSVRVKNLKRNHYESKLHSITHISEEEEGLLQPNPERSDHIKPRKKK